ncbi:aspartate carbamoyltransferase [Candidatus Woesearchaeota archaeon]|nr:aspartate carbamoyltransferase [Candidatus Woesearchaeota archaeon]
MTITTNADADSPKDVRGFLGRDVISISDFSWADISAILSTAAEIDSCERRGANPHSQLLTGKKISLMFFEDSTRTRFSFEQAAQRLGAKTTGFAGVQGTSAGQKGESLDDTAFMISSYGMDAYIIRHSLDGSVRWVADSLDWLCGTHQDIIRRGPIFNAGDGKHEHPTQTLLDIYTIIEAFGNLDWLRIVLSGDLKYGRTVHSLLYAFSLYAKHKPGCGLRVHLISPPTLRMPDVYKTFASESGIKLTEGETYTDSEVSHADIIYATRIQKERMGSEEEFERVKKQLCVTTNILDKMPACGILMHPLPINKHAAEISTDAKRHSKCRVYRQARNGYIVRQALLALTIGGLDVDKYGPYVHSSTTSKGMELDELPVGLEQLNRVGRYTNDIKTFGTVVDHLPWGSSSRLRGLLRIPKQAGITVFNCEGVVGKSGNAKDVLKVEGHHLSDYDLNVIGLIAPRATFTHIKDGKKTRKFRVRLPETVTGLIKCPNPGCISRPEHQEGAPSIFRKDEQMTTEKQLVFRCHYDDTLVKSDEVELLK